MTLGKGHSLDRSRFPRMESSNNTVPPLRRSSELTEEMRVECPERWVSPCYLHLPFLLIIRTLSRRGDDDSGHMEEPGSCNRYPVMPGHRLQGFHFKAELSGL